MIASRRARSRAGRLLCASALLLLPGCTLFDDYLPGSPFATEQPQAEVTLQGQVQVDPITRSSTDCAIGGTVFWGAVRNTGDVDVSDVSISLDVFDAAGGFLGAFGASVFSGEVIENEGGPEAFATNLAVDEAGSFTVCTPIAFGRAARTEYTTRFIVIDESTSR